MFNLGAIAANVLNSLDNAAKDTLEEPRISATALRSQRQRSNTSDSEQFRSDEEEEDGNVEVEKPAEAAAAPVRRAPQPAPKRSNSAGKLEVPLIVPKLPESYSTPSRANSQSKKIGGGYSLSYESASNSSTVSNDGDDQPPATVSSDAPVHPPKGIAEDVGTEDALPEPAASIPSTPTSRAYTDDAPTEEQEAPAAPVTAAAAAAAATPQNLLGSLVNSISSSAKKLPAQLAAGAVSVVSTPATPAAGASTAEAAIVEGDKAGKDANRDKEVMLLKKTLKKKNQEIEKLNRECLDLEEQTTALKQEIQEAWANYKTAQEKAAAVESELQDEIRQIQKAKALDKQQSVAQLSKMSEDVAEAMRQVQAAQAQRTEIQAKLMAANEENAKWEERLQNAQRELAEARSGTVQGVAALQEQLRQMQVSTEQMRADHSALIRQHQRRQEDLERENAELVASVTQQQKEILRLQHFGNASGTGGGTLSDNHDYLTMQQDLITVTGKYEAEKDKAEELDRRLKIAEREARAAQMNLDDERRRSNATIDSLSAKVAELEGKLSSRKLQHPSSGPGAGFLLSSASVDGGEKVGEQGGSGGDGSGEPPGSPLKSHASLTLADYEQAMKELQEHRTQSQNLSKLLLKKQGAVLELQAERSALKSRLIDMQARCSEAERQLAHLRDLEDGGGDHYDQTEEGTTDKEGEGSGAAVAVSSGGLQRRGGGGGGSASGRRVRDNKVISDLERFGVKPGAGVTHAVNVIDSWTLVTGRFLRMYPLARLGCVIYLLVLHLWALFILVLHTHSLELDTDPRDQLMH